MLVDLLDPISEKEWGLVFGGGKHEKKIRSYLCGDWTTLILLWGWVGG